MDFKELLVKQDRWDAGLVRHMVSQLTDDLSEDELNWQARTGPSLHLAQHLAHVSLE